MRIRILGCSGAIAKDCRTTAFLIDHDLLVDSGTGVGDLSLDEMVQIDHVFLTHSHLDHVVMLPLLVDAVGSKRSTPLLIYALPETIATLRTHLFNNVVWPDFSTIPNEAAPRIRFVPIAVGQRIALNGKSVEVLPALHSVPAVGYAVDSGNGHWVYSGDTSGHPDFWRRLNQLQVAMLVIETAFSNREKHLANLSQHLHPAALADELAHMDAQADYPIYITHTKPHETDLIRTELQSSDLPALQSRSQTGHPIALLSCGQEFTL